MVRNQTPSPFRGRRRSVVAVLAAMIMALCVVAGAVGIASDESDAYSKGTQSNPLTSLNINGFDGATQADLGPYYVKVGSLVTITGGSDSDGSDGYSDQITSVTSGFGLSFSNGNADTHYGDYLGKVSGTISKAGTISVGLKAQRTNVAGVLDAGNYTLTIYAVGSTTKTTSINITQGGSKTVTWSESFGTSYYEYWDGAWDAGIDFKSPSGSISSRVSYTSVSSSGFTLKADSDAATGTWTANLLVMDEGSVDVIEEAAFTFTVSAASAVKVTSITISGNTSIPLSSFSSTTTLTATVNPSTATDDSVTWSIQSGSSNVSISSNGKTCTVTGKAIGSAVIKCTANDGSGKSATKTVNVTRPTGVSSGSGTSASPFVIEMNEGEQQNITINALGTFTTYKASGSTISITGLTFKLGTSSYTSISTTGVTGGQFPTDLTISGTPTQAGSWTLIATNPSGSLYYTLKVAAADVPVSSITISGSSSVTVGSTINLSASISPSNATNKSVTWSSSDTSKATVSTSGVVTGKAAGSVTITATAADGSGVKATKAVTVEAASVKVTSITISGSSSVFVGSSIKLTASASPSNATDKTVSWSVQSGSAYASVDSDGTVTGKAAGTAVIKATANDGSGKYATKSITVYLEETFTATLRYNANNGTGAPAEQTASLTGSNLSETTCNFNISTQEPTRAGYTFKGWADTADATFAQYQPGGQIDVKYNNTPKTIYAVWEQNTYTATLKYNANNGTGAPADDTFTGTSTSSHTFTISATKPTRSGYTFLGWADSANASTAKYQPGGTVAVAYNGTKTIYAVWEQNTYTATLKYDTNGGTGTFNDDTFTGTSTSSHTFTISTTKPTKSGYTFKGWADTKTAATAQYQPGGTVSVAYNGTKTIYAVWEQNKYTATLKYDTNGGTGTFNDDTFTGTSTSSHTFTISATKPTKSARPNYFAGWAETSTATTPQYQPGGTVPVAYNGTKTLYAVWYYDYYAGFNASGGTGAPDTLEYFGPESTHTFTIPDDVPTKSGYTFKGWGRGTTQFVSNQPGDTFELTGAATTFYAVWEQSSLSITSNPSFLSVKVGEKWSYTPTTGVSGCTVTVSGASWLSVSNGTVSGTPTTAGTYNVSITVSKTGYTSDTQSFTLKVYSAIGFTSLPSAGIIGYAG